MLRCAVLLAVVMQNKIFLREMLCHYTTASNDLRNF
jgi:hypothetical protein